MSYRRYSPSICSLNITVSVPRPDVPPIYAPLAVPFCFHLFLLSGSLCSRLMLDNLGSPERNGGGESARHKLQSASLLHTFCTEDTI